MRGEEWRRESGIKPAVRTLLKLLRLSGLLLGMTSTIQSSVTRHLLLFCLFSPSSLTLTSCEVISPKTLARTISGAHLFNQIVLNDCTATPACSPAAVLLLQPWLRVKSLLYYFFYHFSKSLIRIKRRTCQLFLRCFFFLLFPPLCLQVGSPSSVLSGFWFWPTCRTLRSSCTGWSGPRCSSSPPSLFWWR